MSQGGKWTPERVAIFRDSFMEFISHVQINSKEGVTVLGDNVYEAQRRFLDCIFNGLAEDIHDFKILKSRQLGITTMSRALSVFWLGMHPGLQGAMVFDTIPHREEARHELMTMINDLPARLKFPTATGGRDLLKLSNGSTLRFLNAGVSKRRTSGTLGRSSGINFAHLSEVCSYDNDEGIVSFKNSLAKDFSSRLYIWESTARGFNSWYKIWTEAKSDNINQRTCFIGWWAKDSQRIERGTPAFEKYGSVEPTESERERIAEVEQLYDHKITQEQLAWYRSVTNPIMGDNPDQNDQDNVVDELWMQEQPFTEMDSFLQSGSTFFPSDKLTNITKNTCTDKFDGYNFYNGAQFLDSMFRKSEFRRSTQLKVWDEPRDGAYYIISADPAFGHDENCDRSAIQVLRAYADCLEQVAEYAYSDIQPEAFSWVICSLCGWYKNSTLILELNGPGEAVFMGMKSLKNLFTGGYLRQPAQERGLYDIFGNVRDYIYSRTDSMGGGGGAYHFKTTGPLKVSIMERLRDFVTNGSLILRSFDVISEMRTVTRKGDTIESEGRNKDDRVITLALGVRAWENSLRRRLVSEGRTKEHEDASQRLSIADQVGLFNKNALDRFLHGKEVIRTKQASATRRSSWRGTKDSFSSQRKWK